MLDVRTTPAPRTREIVERVRARVASEVRVLSDRLRAARDDRRTRRSSCAARARAPEARLFGSPTLSDLVFLSGAPAIKCGPGESERSHTPDEFVLESEILAGARFYSRGWSRALRPGAEAPRRRRRAGAAA